MSNTDMIIKSLNDFNKIVDSKYKNWKHGKKNI